MQSKDYAAYLIEDLEHAVKGTGDYSPENLPEDFYGCAESYYLENALDIRLVVDSSGRIRGGQILLTSGGPTAWLDTVWHEMRVSQLGDVAVLPVNSDICNEISACLADWYGWRYAEKMYQH